MEVEVGAEEVEEVSDELCVCVWSTPRPPPCTTNTQAQSRDGQPHAGRWAELPEAPGNNSSMKHSGGDSRPGSLQLILTNQGRVDCGLW